MYNPLLITGTMNEVLPENPHIKEIISDAIRHGDLCCFSKNAQGPILWLIYSSDELSEEEKNELANSFLRNIELAGGNPMEITIEQLGLTEQDLNTIDTFGSPYTKLDCIELAGKKTEELKQEGKKPDYYHSLILQYAALQGKEIIFTEDDDSSNIHEISLLQGVFQLGTLADISRKERHELAANIITQLSTGFDSKYQKYEDLAVHLSTDYEALLSIAFEELDLMIPTKENSISKDPNDELLNNLIAVIEKFFEIKGIVPKTPPSPPKPTPPPEPLPPPKPLPPQKPTPPQKPPTPAQPSAPEPTPPPAPVSIAPSPPAPAETKKTDLEKPISGIGEKIQERIEAKQLLLRGELSPYSETASSSDERIPLIQIILFEALPAEIKALDTPGTDQEEALSLAYGRAKRLAVNCLVQTKKSNPDLYRQSGDILVSILDKVSSGIKTGVDAGILNKLILELGEIFKKDFTIPESLGENETGTAESDLPEEWIQKQTDSISRNLRYKIAALFGAVGLISIIFGISYTPDKKSLSTSSKKPRKPVPDISLASADVQSASKTVLTAEDIGKKPDAETSTDTTTPDSIITDAPEPPRDTMKKSDSKTSSSNQDTIRETEEKINKPPPPPLPLVIKKSYFDKKIRLYKKGTEVELKKLGWRIDRKMGDHLIIENRENFKRVIISLKNLTERFDRQELGRKEFVGKWFDNTDYKNLD
ncbi:hypothetical protein GF366_04565 [Candidatus Peregrinibacteria bacterium]|nr:hypothetical protein [Candidatus Peregrinibacteria bacterium]